MADLFQKFMDPEETVRRRKVRARIVRRNRIKKEVELGLPASPTKSKKKKYVDEYEFVTQELLKETFVPKFGEDYAQMGKPKDRYIAGALKASNSRPNVLMKPSPIGSRTGTPLEGSTHGRHGSHDTKKPFLADLSKALYHNVSRVTTSNITKGPILPPKSLTKNAQNSLTKNAQLPQVVAPTKAKLKWFHAYRQVIFAHHEKILAKDPQIRSSQERFAYLLYEDKKYEAAAEHFKVAIELGANASRLWRTLGKCYRNLWKDTNVWEWLWDAKGSYEHAMSFLEVSCSPMTLYEYAEVLEALGSFSAALNVIQAVLIHFPTFSKKEEVIFKYVQVQRYLLFDENYLDGNVQDRIDLVKKLIDQLNQLLLHKNITESEVYLSILYTLGRLQELLVTFGEGKDKSLITQANRSFEEIHKIAIKTKVFPTCSGVSWSQWRISCDTYVIWADYFEKRNETLLASDALARALELLPPPPTLKPTIIELFKQMPLEMKQRAQVWILLGRIFFKCNQMEKAIKSMEENLKLQPYHEESRKALSEWFPSKWKNYFDLQDASQVQIARIIRGIWGRERALKRRREVETLTEQKYRQSPYNPITRRNVLRYLKETYAPIFAAQYLAAKQIQKITKKYLIKARIRWQKMNKHEAHIKELRANYHTKKYKYNRKLRRELANLCPKEFQLLFEKEEQSALRIQRLFRAWRVRRQYKPRLFANRQADALQKKRTEAASNIQRLFRRRRPNLLYRRQSALRKKKERLAINLQRLYRRKKERIVGLMAIFHEKNRKKKIQEKERISVEKIQRAWRKYSQVTTTKNFDEAKFLVEHLKRGHDRLMIQERDMDYAARKIQALYRARNIRRALFRVRRVLAPRQGSVIAALIDKAIKESDTTTSSNTMTRSSSQALVHLFGTTEKEFQLAKQKNEFKASRCIVLEEIRTIQEKSALFDHGTIILNSPIEKVIPLRVHHLLSALENSSILHTLVLAQCKLELEGLMTVIHGLQSSRSLRSLALGLVNIILPIDDKESTNKTTLPATPEEEEENANGNSSPVCIISPMRKLSKCFRRNNYLLEELYIEENRLLEKDSEAAYIGEFLADYFFGRYGHLRKLVLTKLKLSDKTGCLIGKALSINHILEHLDLNGNLLADNTATAISESLEENKQLKYLNLADNSIGSDGARALFMSLETKNHCLEHLILCNNNILNDAVSGLHNTIRQNPVLQRVEMSGNVLHPEHLKEIQRCFVERAASPDYEHRLALARKQFSEYYRPLSPNTSPLNQSSPKKKNKKDKNAAANKSPKKLAHQMIEEKNHCLLPSPIKSLYGVFHNKSASQDHGKRFAPPIVSPFESPLKLKSNTKSPKKSISNPKSKGVDAGMSPSHINTTQHVHHTAQMYSVPMDQLKLPILQPPSHPHQPSYNKKLF